MAKWMVKNVKVNTKEMSKALGISPILCRVMVNRGITDSKDAESFLYPDKSKLHNPRLMKDIEKGTKIIKSSVLNKKKILIIGDYDVDGIISTYILYKALKRVGADVSFEIPNRITDGYGINISMIEDAKKDGIDTIITCDNGISAINQIEYAKEMGLEVVITDHHDIPFKVDENNVKKSIPAAAAAVIDPKQLDCNYPFKQICGAGVAFKFIQVLYEEFDIPENEAYSFLEYVAIATVCDVVDLVGENRIIVKEGLSLLENTNNKGIKALIKETGLEGKVLTTYSLGFVIGPCINACGRLDSAKKGLHLLLSEDYKEAEDTAAELVRLNQERKDMTLKGVEDITEIIENTNIKDDKVYIVYDKHIHESVAGIIAGRIRERYNKPTIVLTSGDGCVKGSGRSIDGYNMFEELMKCKDILTKFGGHPMAAGLSLDEENVDILRERLNKNTTLTEDMLKPKIYIDTPILIDRISMELADDLSMLEPFGKGNPKPLFADKNVGILKAEVLGEKQNVLKLKLISKRGRTIDGIYFGEKEELENIILEKYGEYELQKMYNGQKNDIYIDILYNININVYMGNSTLQLIIKYFR